MVILFHCQWVNSSPAGQRPKIRYRYRVTGPFMIFVNLTPGQADSQSTMGEK